MPDNLYDLIIIGCGPAGLTAGIYAGRRDLKTLIITKNIGGQAGSASWVENYPGFEKVNGFELMQK
ncbi:MAG: FAD-binding protein, partial [Candidatus Parcubacteria bacterium]|nr:FAD-binding protein [Candidatus Parcubacteria bacterium]